MTPGANPTVTDRILQEATRLFVAQGYHGISMREIAEAVGLSKAGLYYHFKNKEDLFLAILTNYLARLAQDLDAIPHELTTRARVAGIVAAVFTQSVQQRAIIRLANQEMQHVNPDTRAGFNRIYHTHFIGRIEGMLRAGVARGELRPLDVTLATWVLLGMMYPFLYPANERELGSPDDAMTLLLDIFFDGAAAHQPLDNTGKES